MAAQRDPATPATFYDWARSVPALSMMGSAMLGFELPLRALDKFAGRQQVVDAGHLLARVLWRALTLTGATLEVHGREHLVPGERYLVVANHQGFSDVVVLSNVMRAWQPRYVAKQSLGKGWPSISYLLSATGSAIIDRHQPEAAIAEIERLGAQAKREGWSVAIFPEGTRAKDGVPRGWKQGGIRALLGTTGPVRVLPVSLAGGAELFAHNALPFTAGVEMSCQIHAPVESPDPEQELGPWLEQLRQTVASGL